MLTPAAHHVAPPGAEAASSLCALEVELRFGALRGRAARAFRDRLRDGDALRELEQQLCSLQPPRGEAAAEAKEKARDEELELWCIVAAALVLHQASDPQEADAAARERENEKEKEKVAKAAKAAEGSTTAAAQGDDDESADVERARHEQEAAQAVRRAQLALLTERWLDARTALAAAASRHEELQELAAASVALEHGGKQPARQPAAEKQPEELSPQQSSDEQAAPAH